jgi:septal ring factor EnvC (AmiA/AmiB activator)
MKIDVDAILHETKEMKHAITQDSKEIKHEIKELKALIASQAKSNESLEDELCATKRDSN